MSLLCCQLPVFGPLLAMHAPDGLFSMPVNVVFGAVVLTMLAWAGAVLSRRGDHRLVPVMGIMAAFIFAGQMVNFPIASGTTGHLLGGTLAAILLGPWAGTLVLAAVVFFQALLGDGGLTVLGPNIFNMGIVGACGGYFVYRAVVGQALHRPVRVVAAGFFAAWVAVVLASAFVSLQLAVSETAGLTRALPVMVATHMLIGVGEGLITAFVLAFVLKTRPELLYDRQTAQPRALSRPMIAAGLSASLVVALFLSLLPTLWDYPDGLEFVGLKNGYILEQPERSDDGVLVTLPAYPLGARLKMVDGKVTAVHQYERQATTVAVADVIEQIGPTPVADLETAAVALKFDPRAGTFALQPEELLRVVVRRSGERRELAIRASTTPLAGASPPLIALLPDYTVPGVNGLLSTALAGAIGTIVMFLASLAVGRALTQPSRLARAAAAYTAHSAACKRNP